MKSVEADRKNHATGTGKSLEGVKGQGVGPGDINLGPEVRGIDLIGKRRREDMKKAIEEFGYF